MRAIEMTESLVEKKQFQFDDKCIENGILRHIYHTVIEGNEKRRLPFGWLAFGGNGKLFGCIDSRGNLFIFDFEQMSFWSFDSIATNCSCVTFEASTTNILIGFRDGRIASVDTLTGQILSRFQAFTQPIRAIMQAPQRPDVILCHTKAEILLYCRVNGILCNRNVFKVASIKSNVTNLSIKQVLWTRTAPNTLAVLCLMSDDSIYVWENSQATVDIEPHKLIKMFELRKHIHPLEWRSGSQEKRQDEVLEPDDENNNNVDAVKDFTSGEIWAMSLLTTERSRIVVHCTNRECVVADANQWKLDEVIPRVPQCTKIPPMTVERSFAESILNRPVETVWAAINGNDQLFLFEKCDDEIPPMASLAVTQVTKLRISDDGKLMAAVQKDGVILLLDTEFFLRNLLAIPTHDDSATILNEIYIQQTREINQKLRKMLPHQRMLTILKEYGEYPAEHRQNIWRTMLKLPLNANAFTDLLKKGPHPCVRRLYESYPLRDADLMKQLSTIMSCLAHWSCVFSLPCEWQANFLPTFIFPFVKYISRNSLLAFETIVTILLNQCQLWMEFCPVEPINYLGLCENILAHFEPTLSKFYGLQGVQSKVFAWSLARTAFTEALDEPQWLQLWDHVVSGPSYFLVFAIVAFNSMHKATIIRLYNAEAIERYFDEPPAMDMNAFLKRIYHFMAQCPERLHPKQYMVDFEPLANDQYQKFTNYPKQLFDKRAKCADGLVQERQLISKKYAELERIELAMIDRLGNAMRADEHQRRMRNVELAYEETMLRELERVEQQRKHLILYERQIYDREMAFRLAQIESEQQHVIDERKSELQSVVNQCERNKICDETDIFAAEETFRQREMKLLMQKHRQSSEPAPPPLAQQFNEPVTQLAEGRKKLKSTLHEIATRDKNGSSEAMALNRNDRKIGISIETLEQATNQLEKDVTEMLSQMTQRK